MSLIAERHLPALGRGLRVWLLLAACAALAGACASLPLSSEPNAWRELARSSLLLVAAIGGFVAWRWELGGAALTTFAAVCLGVLGTLEFDSRLSQLACVAFLLPGLLLWALWGRERPPRAALLAAGGMLLALAVTLGCANWLHDRQFGPQHPQSALAAERVELVQWIWAGAASDTSITIQARIARDEEVRLLVGTSADMREPLASEPQEAGKRNRRVVSFTVDGLNPGTRYWYALEADGEADLTRRGTFQTFPAAETPAGFTFAVASCARNGSNGAVFDAIRRAGPLFFLHTGDLHYTYIDEDDPDRFRAAYQQVLTRPAQAALYRSLPTAYVWDDHDYGLNNGDRTTPSRAAAQRVYREIVPHYALPAGDDGAIYQAFTVGRARFILTDLRSERDPNDDEDGPDKSMLGEEQKAWLKQELLAANGHFPLIIWVNSVPWIDDAGTGKDTWGGFTTERREIADFIAENDIQGLLMLSGDAHMLGIDDGSHSDYATNGGAAFPVFHAAPLDRTGEIKGGPYSHGVRAEPGQFGLVTVQDDGGAITVTLSGRDYTGAEVMRYEYQIAGSGE